MIQGTTLKNAFISAYNSIANVKQKVDELNVFPVPDGDTGNNMSMTMSAAARQLEREEGKTVSAVANTAASAMLRGARGNSGVILSLLFRGFSKGLAGKDTASGKDLANALTLGVEAAYKAVMKPTEGTILTVARMAAEKATKFAETTDDAVAVFENIYDEARAALALTPEMLPVLKKAGVVDAGGQGLVYILEGMLAVIRDGNFVEIQLAESAPVAPPPSAARDAEFNITYLYCTEFLINKSNPDADALKLRAFVESIGDSVVVVDDTDIIKCHVHTDNPGQVLDFAVKYGMLSSIKIENMYEQHQELQKAEAPKAQPKKRNQYDYEPVDPTIDYGFVAVSAGEGISNIFTELGVNRVVSGGQTMNPSTEDLLSAIQATPAKTVFVLPNNKNIIMAAEQAVALADRKVCVIHTKNIQQGVSAMLAFDPGLTAEQNCLSMTKSFEAIQTGSITYAARDSDFGGLKIREGDIMALDNGKVSFIAPNLTKASTKLVRQLLSKGGSYVTMYYGSSVSADTAAEIENAVREKLPDDVEIVMVNGGQPVYYFLISVE
ncbi:MAG: DAK2 domain-containing protein [Oscillospiraceae bacterium]|nr:DAK2 domain-containing protein [Oscillospiraceae bacterium]